VDSLSLGFYSLGSYGEIDDFSGDLIFCGIGSESVVVIVKGHGHTKRLCRGDSSKDDKEESSEHHYHFVDIKVKTKVRRRLRSFNALNLYIFT
jgi:hypothetical protein